jgi:hypothetical protein
MEPMIMLSIQDEKGREVRKIELTESSFHHLQRRLPPVTDCHVGIRTAITDARRKLKNFSELTNGTGILHSNDVDKIHGYFFYCTRKIRQYDPEFIETFHFLRKFFREALSQPQNTITFVRT